MGACCSKRETSKEGLRCREEEEEDDELFEEGNEGSGRSGDDAVRVRVAGSCSYASMFTQQGWKGVNQDAMTIWEDGKNIMPRLCEFSSMRKFQQCEFSQDFAGSKGEIFCGVFDGHGPLGHKVARHVRDVLPSMISSGLRSLQSVEDSSHPDSIDACKQEGHEMSNHCERRFALSTDIFVKAFEDLDEELGHSSSIDCICSGTTAVSIVVQKEHMITANLGDSRAILATRDDKNQLVPLQLTVDLKPNLPSEEERIRSCKGRVFALEEEPDVHRLWLPDEDCPGLAMARAFGDFCLKDFGLISTPQVSHRKLSDKDEFVVLATDGVWDVLSNKEVVEIVSSASKRADKRSGAAKMLVKLAVRAWRNKHPTSKIDDCAVICLFLRHLPFDDEDGEATIGKSMKQNGLSSSESFKAVRSEPSDSEKVAAVVGGGVKEEWAALEGVSRVNSLLKLPRLVRC